MSCSDSIAEFEQDFKTLVTEAKMMQMRVIFLLSLALMPATAFGQSLFDAAHPGARATGFGKSVTASIHDPLAALWNPAALAFMREAQFRISADSPFSFNYLGISQFFPLIGTAAAGLSEYALLVPQQQTGNEGGEAVRTLQRISLGLGRTLSPRLLAGGSLHLNSLGGKDFTTLSVGFLAFPNFSHKASPQPAYLSSLFNPVALDQNYALALTIQDIQLGRKHLKGYVDLGAYLRPVADGPVFQAALQTNGDREKIRLGAGFALNETISLFSGIEDFQIRKAAFGLSLQAASHSIDVAYSQQTKNIMVDFSVRLGRSATERAELHKRNSLALARRNAYLGAYREVRSYLEYIPGDSISLQLRAWLEGKLAAQQEKIEGLFAKAKKFEQKKWYISATLIYLNILDLDERNKRAKRSLQRIQPKVDSYINQLYQQGVQAYDEGYYEQAERAFKAVLLVRKGHAKAEEYLRKLSEHFAKQSDELFWQGLGYFTQKKYDSAIAAFKKSLNYKKDNEEAQTYLKKAIEEKQVLETKCRQLLARARMYERGKKFADAIETYKTIIKLDPMHQEAKDGLKKIQPYVDRFVNTYLVRGKSAFQQGQFEQANKAFSKALDYDPGNRTAKNYLARIDQIQTRNLEASYQKGLEYFAAKEWQQAIAAFDEVLGKNGRYKEAHQKRREAYSHSRLEELLDRAEQKFRSGRYLEALELYTHVSARQNSNELAAQRIQECQQHLEQEVEKYFSRGINYYTREKYSDAIREWNKVLRIDPDHAQAIAYKRKAEERLSALNRLP